MTANQCHRPNLGNPQIYESFSVCSFRNSTASQCCSTKSKHYQCWNYCAVPESEFPTWLSCVQKVQNDTWGAACQRARDSPVLTATTPYPASFTQPTPPEGYYEHLNGRGINVTARTTGSGGNMTMTTHLPSATPTETKKSGSTRAWEVSMGGIVCALLVFSTVAL